ncbi:MAG: signal peptidase I [Firmicutes bacterium]|nr:signal peptidase I [Bacillota bacterium]
MGELRKAKKRKKMFNEIVSLAVILLIAIVFRLFVFGVVIIKGASMEPSLFHNDVAVINKISRLTGSFDRGDIVVCLYNKGISDEYIIKRVIGVPGDVIDVEMGDDYHYYININGERLNEPYIKEPMDQTGDIEYPFTVEDDSYFIMGDNRNNSNDSRSKLIGSVSKNNIKGKLIAVVLPLNRIGIY